jgi:hypothetical protein
MSRTVFAVAAAGLIVAAVSGTAQSAPLAPLAPGLAAHLTDDLTEVVWRHCWRGRWGRLHCRRCLRDAWGRVRCV